MELGKYSKIEWDVVVVGTGMGGSVCGHELAKCGKKVLFLEIGPYTNLSKKKTLSKIQNVVKDGYWPKKIKGTTTFGKLDIYPTMGHGVGGSTLLYAAQLERFHISDFKPKKFHKGQNNLPLSWPISYDDLSPFYKKAEILLNVCGGNDKYQPEEFQKHLMGRELTSADKKYLDYVNECNVDAYISHFIEDKNNSCRGCGGMICPSSCKRDLKSICIDPAIEQYGASILANAEVLSINMDGHIAKSVNVKINNENIVIDFKVIILAAGALFTPKILLNTKSKEFKNGLGNNNDLVGRNLMWHSSDFFVLRTKRFKPIIPDNTKLLSCNKFYEYKGTKLGTFQSGGSKIKAGQVKSFLLKNSMVNPIFFIFKFGPLVNLAASIFEYIGSTFEVFSTVIEDLPYKENRVYLDDSSDSGISFNYSYSNELRLRSNILKKLIRVSFKKNFWVFFLTGKNNLNWGHPSGTCRFGKNSAESVIDSNNCIHDVKNVYVTDSSFFPSSGGTNPSLTIAANSIRVSKIINNSLDNLDTTAREKTISSHY
jgi:choline dehydrogenase-like flavoprotein